MPRRLARSRHALLALGLVCLSATAARADLSDGWVVFENATISTPNLLLNSGAESGPSGSADSWTPFGPGYSIDLQVVHGGSRSFKLRTTQLGQVRGAYQVVTLNQPVARPLLFGGWSRVQALWGTRGSDYAIYLDVAYADGTNLFAQVVTFPVGTTAWQYGESIILPEKPVKSIAFYVLLRTGYVGTAWFDDLALREFPAGAAVFDHGLVLAPAAPPDLGGAQTVSISTDDGLGLALTGTSGALAGLDLDGTSLVPSGRAYTGGFFARDAAAGSAFVHAGGTVVQAGRALDVNARFPALNLTMSASIVALADSIDVHGELADLTGTDRAITLYFALPVDAGGWRWGDDPRHSRAIRGTAEFRVTAQRDGLETGFGSYPWSAATGLPRGDGTAAGLSLGFPLDAPRQVRTVVHPDTRQLYVAFDLGLSPAALKGPQRASFAFRIYRHTAGWPYGDAASEGFRAAAQRYYDIYPQSFAWSDPAGGQGIWVAFVDLAPIPNLADFGIAYHEGVVEWVPFDDTAGIATFRYVTEPWSYHMPIYDPTVDNTNYDQVMAYLRTQYEHGTGRDQEMAEATLSSGSFDEPGRYRFFPEAASWCNAGGNCAVFILDPDPDVNVPPYTVNKAWTDWNPDVKAVYDTLPTLDGEYVDGSGQYSLIPNFRREHFSAADMPLAFDPATHRVMIPELVSIAEFTRVITDDIHGRGKLTMSNAFLNDVPFTVEQYDFNGAETDWLRTGSFRPQDDRWFNYRRALSYRKPFGMLMHTDFAALTPAQLERYMQISLFYGIYPSTGVDTVTGARYWERPDLYERDRPLFRKYVPLVREVSLAGWRPITGATASDSLVSLERWGTGTTLRLTVRNDSDLARVATISVDTAAVGLPAAGSRRVRDRIDGNALTVGYGGGRLSFDWSLSASGVALLAFDEVAPPPPVPDGKTVSGSAVRVARAAGETLTVTWDATRCPAPSYHIVWYDLAAIASYAISAVTCAAGSEGHWTGAPPAGSVGLLVVADDGAGTEGSYGPEGSGDERPSSIHACGISVKRTDGACP